MYSTVFTENSTLCVYMYKFRSAEVRKLKWQQHEAGTQYKDETHSQCAKYCMWLVPYSYHTQRRISKLTRKKNPKGI